MIGISNATSRNLRGKQPTSQGRWLRGGQLESLRRQLEGVQPESLGQRSKKGQSGSQGLQLEGEQPGSFRLCRTWMSRQIHLQL